MTEVVRRRHCIEAGAEKGGLAIKGGQCQTLSCSDIVVIIIENVSNRVFYGCKQLNTI